MTQSKKFYLKRIIIINSVFFKANNTIKTFQLTILFSTTFNRTMLQIRCTETEVQVRTRRNFLCFRVFSKWRRAWRRKIVKFAYKHFLIILDNIYNTLNYWTICKVPFYGCLYSFYYYLTIVSCEPRQYCNTNESFIS